MNHELNALDLTLSARGLYNTVGFLFKSGKKGRHWDSRLPWPSWTSWIRGKKKVYMKEKCINIGFLYRF